MSDRFDLACGAIDAANADDPIVIRVDVDRDGSTHRLEGPKEVVHAQLMFEWVQTLDPDADECQLLAARAHHVRRWEYPRSSEPDGRAGYLRWRTEARRRHAELVGALLRDAGYGAPEIGRVQSIVSKEGLKRGGLLDVDGRSPAVQVHEDALCLVFLETQLVETADRLGDDAMVDVLVKTLPKMSERGRRAALGLDLGDRGGALVSQALDRFAASP